MNKIQNATTISAVDEFGFKYWEVQLIFENGEGKVINVSLDTMRSMGVTKRIDGFSKINKFLESKEGLKWIEENLGKMKKKRKTEFL